MSNGTAQSICAEPSKMSLDSIPSRRCAIMMPYLGLIHIGGRYSDDFYTADFITDIRHQGVHLDFIRNYSKKLNTLTQLMLLFLEPRDPGLLVIEGHLNPKTMLQK